MVRKKVNLRSGRVKRSGASCKGSVTPYVQKKKKQVVSVKKCNWCANMKRKEEKMRYHEIIKESMPDKKAIAKLKQDAKEIKAMADRETWILTKQCPRCKIWQKWRHEQIMVVNF